MTAIEPILICMRDMKEAGEPGDWFVAFGKVRWGFWMGENLFIEWGYTGRCTLVRRKIFSNNSTMLTHAYQSTEDLCYEYKVDHFWACRFAERDGHVLS